MKSCLFSLLLISLLSGCADEIKSPLPEAQLPDSVNKAKQFFPILDYLKGELNNVDSFATAIRSYSTIDGKTDSGIIKVEQFKGIMQEFLAPELSKENFEKYYSESSFFDQTTQTSTFTYATKNDDLEFHRIDVLVQGSDSYDKVSSIYMEKFTGGDDSSVVKKMLLVGGKSMMINSETTLGANKPVIRQDKFVWNDWE
ncbi:MAG: hypothetical protein EOO04_17240 [Chitinophagaceae bacterium]|nr:MAG: hypothetical protein EOO04_17240 [Chitinophagaceae bacterium]